MRGSIMGAAAAGLLALTGCSDAGGGQQDQAAAETARGEQTEVTRKIATAFLNRLFIEGDPGAYAEFATPDFIQHNPGITDGVAAQRAYMDGLLAAGAAGGKPAGVIDMVLVDGDLFAAMHHTVSPDGTGRITVDLWRVENGRIAEHWDVIQDMPLDSAMPHRNGMGCGLQTYAEASARANSVEGPACGVPDPNVPRAASLANYQAYVDEVGKGDVLGAIEKWFHPAYRQHSPVIADGKQGAIDYLMAEWGDPDAPRPILGEQRVIAEGDLVLIHYMYALEGIPGEEAHIDIFRFTDGKISEHWDVKQKVPENPANSNGMW